MRTYSVETRQLGITIKFTTVQAPNALAAIDLVAVLNVAPCNEYVARRIR